MSGFILLVCVFYEWLGSTANHHIIFNILCILASNSLIFILPLCFFLCHFLLFSVESFIFCHFRILLLFFAIFFNSSFFSCWIFQANNILCPNSLQPKIKLTFHFLLDWNTRHPESSKPLMLYKSMWICPINALEYWICYLFNRLV